ncbi:hypothetical protein [Alteribacter keqinensis]|uniref:Uncharacterized protein n=1 Tax=Alteribacter keqinensis TaxID=2483800 RepID=A0A3M7TPS1_9BACI|nr:hypothetical protein [Alteribacter keqinensis]RNA67017.1 hypothetical protein EBO34_17665 [Alteribacter keqinensis]
MSFLSGFWANLFKWGGNLFKWSANLFKGPANLFKGRPNLFKADPVLFKTTDGTLLLTSALVNFSSICYSNVYLPDSKGSISNS